MDAREASLRWVRGLTDKEFAQFFYDAVQGRDPGQDDSERRRFVLADASFSSTLDIDYIATPADPSREWADDAPICQSGQCSRCKAQCRSWAKEFACPVCGNTAYGT